MTEDAEADIDARAYRNCVDHLVEGLLGGVDFRDASANVLHHGA